MPDYSRNRAERDFNLNPPSSAPGQGDDWDSLFSDTNSSNAQANNFSGTDTDINAILNGTTQAPGVQTQSGGIPPQSFGDVVGDKLGDAAILGAKGIWEYSKVVVTSLMNNKEDDWNALGDRMCKISVWVLGFSVLETILSATVIRSLYEQTYPLFVCPILFGR